MGNVLKHKGYIGSIDIDAEDNYLHGAVQFINDCIIYDGETVEEIKQSFIDAVEGYLAMCAELDKIPDAPCSGTFNVRISPELHRKCQHFAFSQGISLNATVERALQRLCDNAEQKPQTKQLQDIQHLVMSVHETIKYSPSFTHTINVQHQKPVNIAYI